MTDWLYQSWPWYVAGPLIGLLIPMLLFIGNKLLGISSSLRHTCAACVPANVEFLKYDWKKEAWNLFFVAGIVMGGYIAVHMLPNMTTPPISPVTTAEMQAYGITTQSGMLPTEIFNWNSLFTPTGFLLIVFGGFLVGFGSRYAGGCTSGHAIMGLSSLQWPSLIAVLAFFAGGLLTTHLIFPLLF